MASIDIEIGPLLVDPPEVGPLELIPSTVKFVEEANWPERLLPELKGDKSINEVKLRPITGKRVRSLAVTAVEEPKLDIDFFIPLATTVTSSMLNVASSSSKSTVNSSP